MKKIYLLAALLAVSTTAAMAQTEAGSFRVGGTSNLGFTNIKLDGDNESTNRFNLGLDAGYFVIDNLSVDLGVMLQSEKYDGVSQTNLVGALGLRYYFPPKVFVGAGFDLINSKDKYDGDDVIEGYSESVSGTGLNFTAGYAAFVSDHFAIEPAISYRLGLSDKNDGTKANGFGAQVGLSFYF